MAPELRAHDRTDEPHEIALRLTRWLSLVTMAPPGALALAEGLRHGRAGPWLLAMTAIMLSTPLLFFAVRRAPLPLQAWLVSSAITAVAWLGLLHFGPGISIGATLVTAAVSWTLFFGRRGMIGAIASTLVVLALFAWAYVRGLVHPMVVLPQDGLLWLRVWVAIAGNVVFVCGITHVVWNRYRRLLDAERRARREADAAARARDEFLSLASHELRTPLTALKLHVQAIGAGRAVDDRTMRSIERQVRRLERLVRTFLDVTSLDAGRALVREEVDLAELAREVIADVGAVMRSPSDVSLRAPRSVVGRWDRVLVEQLVAQVLGNAIKFGGGGPIDVAVEGEGREARLVVRDRGRGIPEDARAHVFERFGRGVPWTHFGGLGLGLHLALRIARLHGGDLLLDAVPGDGSVVTIVLPRDAAAPAPAPRRAPDAASVAADTGRIG